jgi:hypothetical protein
MSDHGHHEEATRPAIEQDARIARVLGLVLFLVLSVFGFYVGTIGGKPWVYDYQPKDMIPGFKGAVVGAGLAFVINIVIYTYYKNVISKDVEKEWYEPQAGHGHH